MNSWVMQGGGDVISAALKMLVRGEVWWFGNPSGSCPNFFGRQYLTFAKGGKSVSNF